MRPWAKRAEEREAIDGDGSCADFNAWKEWLWDRCENHGQFLQSFWDLLDSGDHRGLDVQLYVLCCDLAEPGYKRKESTVPEAAG